MIAGIMVLSFSSCEEQLETFPTESVSGPTIFNDVNGAFVAMNGIYRHLFEVGWQATGNHHQNFGVKSTVMTADLMGEDFVQLAQGSGWFWYDYTFAVRTRYTSSTWRSYATWNYYYFLITNLNSIIAAAEGLQGDPAEVSSVIGQAYALRAMSYFELAQFFQQTYVGNETKPGIPIYTEPTTPQTEGKPRGTLQEVYTQINADIEEALKLLKEAAPQKHKSHIDYHVASVFAARIYSVQGRWNDVETAAANALAKFGSLSGAVAANGSLMNGFNSLAGISTVMWGNEVIEDQATVYASFFSHMDSRVAVDKYARTSRKAISSFLETQMGANDARRGWWRAVNFPVSKLDPNTGDSIPYNQIKFRYATPGVEAGDYIYIRAEEPLLMLAEAQCRLDKYPQARATLAALGTVRDPNFMTRLDARTDSKTLTVDANNTQSAVVPVTLLDEIIMQRRIELWGEFGRIFDIQRLKIGFTRNFANSNHPSGARDNTSNRNFTTASKEFIMTIPQAEFDGNVNMGPEDQNPM